GILSTIYGRLLAPATTAELAGLYAEFYGGEPFVRVLPAGGVPSTAHVRGPHFCDLGVVVDQRTGRVIVVSAIDNLVKGASGQAVQNMNIMCGLPEGLGVEGLALVP